MLMQNLQFFTHTAAFYAALQPVLQALPIVGDASPTDSLVLAHYSPDPGITAFAKNARFSWSSGVSDDPKGIEKLIGMYSTLYQAIYLIKLGIGSTYKPRNHNQDFMDEYAIDISLSSNDFIAVLIKYDLKTGKYIII